MPDDISAHLDGWVPELELSDIAKRIQNIHEYLSKLETTYDIIISHLGPFTARLEANGASIIQAANEMTNQVQQQDSLDIGDPDINEEVITTLQRLAIDIKSAIQDASHASSSLASSAGGLEESREALSDLAEYVSNY